MSKWFTKEGMDTIMSLSGIERIRLLFSTVFPDTLPIENATYGRLNKNSSIAMLTIKVGEDTFIQTEGSGDDSITICGVSFNWWYFKSSTDTKVGTVNEQEQESLRNLWAYTCALNKAYSLILVRHREIGYDALDRINRVLMIVDHVLGSYLVVEDELLAVNREISSLMRSETRIWNKSTFDRMFGRYVVNNEGMVKREIDPVDTLTVLASVQKHSVDDSTIVIEDHVSRDKPIVKVIDLKVSYTYINEQLNKLIEKYRLKASEVKDPLADVVKGMLLAHLFQKHVDVVGKHDGLNNVKYGMTHRLSCGHLNLIKPVLVRISEEASRIATELVE